ncbi:MAG: hypothetical protein HGA76_07170 [Candidatus Firestonebacteria bacterium]|nr:hypothetical protein [Candidatus Firestonebacteria bacterium]
MSRLRRLTFFAVLACGLAWSAAADAAVWKSSGQIGLTGFAAEADDSKQPMTVAIRVENHSKLAAVSVSRYFVQMSDGEKKLLRPVTADEIVSDRLQKLRELLPQNVREIDHMMGEIQADYPQQKIVDVYARLKQFMAQNRPTHWRSNLENWILGKRYSTDAELTQAQVIIEEIGDVAKNYLWPRDIAPDTVYTGLVFFERPPKDPLHIYFEIDHQFLGNTMALDSGDKGPRPR